MELRNEIDLDLWKAVSKKYEVEDYSGAMIDAFLSLTETIRKMKIHPIIIPPIIIR